MFVACYTTASSYLLINFYNPQTFMYFEAIWKIRVEIYWDGNNRCRPNQLGNRALQNLKINIWLQNVWTFFRFWRRLSLQASFSHLWWMVQGDAVSSVSISDTWNAQRDKRLFSTRLPHTQVSFILGTFPTWSKFGRFYRLSHDSTSQY